MKGMLYAVTVVVLALLTVPLAARAQPTGWVEAGGLMSYGARDIDLSQRAAYYVDKLLRGTKAADLPVE